MTFRAQLAGGATQFDIDVGETVLDAALRQGVVLDYGCRHGNCSKCKYYLSEGDIDFGNASIYSLSDDEREEGFGLLCCATPLSDLVIEARGSADPRAKPQLAPRGREGRIASVTQLTPSLWQLVLDLDEPLSFYAGQFVELNIAGDDVWRAYSVASDPIDATRLEFVMKHLPDGAFSGRLPALTAGMTINVRGPYGSSYLRDGDEDVVLVATGAGISPILSILRFAMRSGDARRFTRYYGARKQEDVPFDSLFAEIAATRADRIAVRMSFSQACATTSGFRGRVTQALQYELGDASRLDAYICGAPEMCETVGTLLEAKGIRQTHLTYDKFHAATMSTCTFTPKCS
jgi:NAD(P)H-flavin reductase/ferredoxin